MAQSSAQYTTPPYRPHPALPPRPPPDYPNDFTYVPRAPAKFPYPHAIIWPKDGKPLPHPPSGPTPPVARHLSDDPRSFIRRPQPPAKLPYPHATVWPKDGRSVLRPSPGSTQPLVDPNSPPPPWNLRAIRTRPNTSSNAAKVLAGPEAVQLAGVGLSAVSPQFHPSLKPVSPTDKGGPAPPHLHPSLRPVPRVGTEHSDDLQAPADEREIPLSLRPGFAPAAQPPNTYVETIGNLTLEADEPLNPSKRLQDYGNRSNGQSNRILQGSPPRHTLQDVIDWHDWLIIQNVEEGEAVMSRHPNSPPEMYPLLDPIQPLPNARAAYFPLRVYFYGKPIMLSEQWWDSRKKIRNTEGQVCWRLDEKKAPLSGSSVWLNDEERWERRVQRRAARFDLQRYGSPEWLAEESESEEEAVLAWKEQCIYFEGPRDGFANKEVEEDVAAGVE
ncbi:MAG: hypothetical protein Q9201_001633 [Fulgogasparrea decipioides]